MVEKSYNGWTAIRPEQANANWSSTNKNPRTIVIEPVKGCKLRVRNEANVKLVFTYIVQQFHKRVDNVTKPHPADDWGYAYRPNRNNPSQLSNHSSGTAIDLDATEHPNGVATTRTYTSKQINEVHAILKELDGTVRWGGDYRGTPDAMHFEINVSAGELKKVGDKIKKLGPGERLSSQSNSPGDAPYSAPAGSLIYKLGLSDPAVRTLKERLVYVLPSYKNLKVIKDAGLGGSLAINDTYDKKTEAWIKEFQRRTGLEPDGVVGPLTKAKLLRFGIKVK